MLTAIIVKDFMGSILDTHIYFHQFPPASSRTSIYKGYNQLLVAFVWLCVSINVPL